MSGAASGKGRETPACSLELAARTGRLSGLRLVSRGREVVEPADKLLLLVGEAEHGREPARRDEVLTALDRAFGIPERGAHRFSRGGQSSSTPGHTRVAPVVDRARSADRIEREIETLSGPDFTTSNEAIRRYAYTPEYRRTLDHFTAALEEVGFDRHRGSAGHARRAQPAARRARLRHRLPLRLEPERRALRRDDGRRHRARGVSPERGARARPPATADLVPRGGGLGVRADAARQPDHAPAGDQEDLRERFRAIDDGRSFWEHAEAAGYEPGRWRESSHVLDDLTGWIEMHIEQARVLQDTGKRIGVVNAIAGYVHADIRVQGARRPRGRDADGAAPRPDDGAGGDGPRAGAPRDRGGAREQSAPSARSRSTRAHQRGRGRGALLARRAAGRRTTPSSRSRGKSRSSRR